MTLLETYKKDLLTNYAQRTKKDPEAWVAKNICMLPVSEYLRGPPPAEDSPTEDTPPEDLLYEVPEVQEVPEVPEIPEAAEAAEASETSEHLPDQESEESAQDSDPDQNPDQESEAEVEVESGSESEAESEADKKPHEPNVFDYEMNNEISLFPALKEVSLKYTGTLSSYAAKHNGHTGVMIAYNKDKFPADLRAQLIIMQNGTDYRMLFGLPYTEGTVCDIVDNNKCFFYINRRYRQTEDYLFDKLKYIFGCPHITTK